MILPSILKNNPPREIQYSDAMFANVRSMVKTAFTYSLLCLPTMGMGYWLKGSDPVDGLFAGIGTAAFVDFIVLTLMLNFKSGVSVCRDGTATIGTIKKILSKRNLIVIYQDQEGQTRQGMAFFIGATTASLKELDQIPIVFLEKKPQTFIAYLDNEGISMVGNGGRTGMTSAKHDV